jgi:outer membrane receptor for ferrienterochelin and colicins
MNRPSASTSAVSLITTAIALAFSTSALAQSGGDAAPQTIVVTGSAIEKALADAPASISVLTRSEIEKKPVQEVAELLGSVPGVTLSRSGNLVPGVQLRGLGAAYTLVLVDGRRVNSTSAVFRGNDYDFGWVPAEEIERIEVVRGPMSSLYGSDAIGGVVNIIARRVGKAWRGSVRVDAVEQENELAGNSRVASFSVSGPLVADTLGLKIHGGYDEREADSAQLNPPAANGTRQSAMPKLENKYLSAQLAWTPSANHDVMLDFDAARRDHGGFLVDRDAWALRHKGRFGFGRTEARLYGDKTQNLTGTVTGQTNPNQAESRIVDAKVSLPFDLFEQTLSLGGEVRNEKLTDRANLSGPPGSTPRADPSTEVGQKALFVEDEIRFTKQFALTLGARHDDHDNFGGHTSPRVYGVFQLLPGLSLKAGWAKAFRAPTLLQNSPNWGSVSCGSPTVGCYIVGSDQLEPETSTSQEIGLLWDAGRFGAGLTFFDTKLKNMIDITNRTADRTLAPGFPNFVGFLPDGRPIFRYQNINSVKTRGAEASARATLLPGLELRASYTYTDAKNTSGAIALPLTYRPKDVANLGIDWQALPGWTLGASARHTGKQYISVPANGQNMLQAPAYTMLDLTAAWQINTHLTLRAGALNATDKVVARQTSLEFNEEQRRFFLSATARF